ncbi:hypothetical protein [Pseudomonas sp. PARCl1]|nr:hypothetical protein [Pseudomonas sp. PARCl1]
MNSLNLLPWKIEVHQGFLSEPTTFQVKDSAGNAVSDFYLSKEMANFISCAPLLLADLIDAAAQLRKYEALHRAKGTAESLAKAEANAILAFRFEQTISTATGVKPVIGTSSSLGQRGILTSQEPEQI